MWFRYYSVICFLYFLNYIMADYNLGESMQVASELNNDNIIAPEQGRTGGNNFTGQCL